MDLFPQAIEASVPNKLAIYLGGKYKSLPGQEGQCLQWWKEHHKEIPVLVSLAKDYLACSATLASVEQCFSAAADGFKANDEFQTAQDFVSQDLMEEEESKTKFAAA
ncbi:hypothetical protein PGT21_024467 [Puccinia graminis f. sp. tritici]|uniref:HAT C-terminal dimerisation domain-containing protein n=1 Tax=Puccinia graminis f. sp. tritici TaxID=56615 RepID=A0A5B0N1G2_PUCGR|nr:hypothetical protein PGT21_024467 [Puccinia graminis f. sp. tritici]KAA1123996.1 hypothetical protein PGTUg99_017136 [Puccinia graminis f. sp. tritici]